MMKKNLFFLTLLVGSFVNAQATSETFNWSILPDTVYVTQPLRAIPIIEDLFPDEEKEHVYSNNMRRNKFTNANALPQGNDPQWQNEMGNLQNRGPIANWEGVNNGLGFPPDPSGAAGPNHYVQMVNSRIQIFDKQGNTLYGPNALSSILSSNNGDPIVMYDKYADRWFLSGFGQGNSLSFAMSNTADPTGTYTVWNYSLSSFPDYPKYGVWHDGYYVTANTGGPDCYILERDEMLLGAAGSPQFVSLTIPSLITGAGTNTGGFHSVVPASADFTLPPATEKLNLFYFEDDAWSGVPNDRIKIWEVTADWNNVSNSSCTQIQTLNVAPFDSQFNSNWDDITQPGTSQKLDGIPGAFMYRAQYTQWPVHNTVVLNHTVDVNATNQAGIRWYELRNSGTNWTIHQQSTYSPDNHSRWLASLSMDNQGNIGMAYSLSSGTAYPSIMFTGRYATDPLNMMSIAEDTIILGSGSQSGGNRFGDYAHMTVDPDDDQTFWYTGEYVDGGGRSTRIASFKLASSDSIDIGVTLLNTPANGVLTNSEIISVDLKNFGYLNQDNFDVNYQINNGPIVTETYAAGPILPGLTDSYTFTQTADLSTIGIYNFKFFTSHPDDQNLINDTIHQEVIHLFPNDIGVSIVNNPSTDNNLMMETVTVTVENFGTASQSNFSVGYQINGGTPIVETFSNPLAPGTSTTYSFSTLGDFTSLGTYEVAAYTALLGDQNNGNDTTIRIIENSNCTPISNCTFGDGLTRFAIGTLNNPSGCTPGGYTDYSILSTDLIVGYSQSVTVETNANNQYLSVWIDFNDNFFFEPSEKVIAAFQFNSQGTTTFLLADTAPLGEHLLRAKASDQIGDVNDACADMQYGETQDYSVNLVNDLKVEQENISEKIKVQSLANHQYILDAAHLSANVQLTIYNSLGQIVYQQNYNAEKLKSIKLDFSEYTVGAYLVSLKTSTQSAIVKLMR